MNGAAMTQQMIQKGTNSYRGTASAHPSTTRRQTDRQHKGRRFLVKARAPTGAPPPPFRKCIYLIAPDPA